MPVVRQRRIIVHGDLAVFRVRAVTLLEVLLAMGILVFLSSMTYWFYAEVLKTRNREAKQAEQYRIARVVLDQMAREIRQASLITHEERIGLRGEAERIWLSTLRVPSRDITRAQLVSAQELPAEFDLTKIEYRIVRHPELLDEEGGYEIALGLARIEHRIPRPDSAQTGEAFKDEHQVIDPNADPLEEELFEDELTQGKPEVGEDIRWDELYAQDIKFLRFCYYDGYRWWDDWDIAGENPLPQMVQITIGLKMRPPFDSEFGVRDPEAGEFCTCMNREPMDCRRLPDDQFSIIVRIPQADLFFRSRVTKETQNLVKNLSEEEDQGEEQP